LKFGGKGSGVEGCQGSLSLSAVPHRPGLGLKMETSGLRSLTTT
jgi:hypothetical protein